MSEFNEGDRIIVISSAFGVYNGKKGVVTRIIEEGDYVEIILDINRGTIAEKTIMHQDNIKIDPSTIVVEDRAEQTSNSIRKIMSEVSSIDDRMDNLDIILGRYGIALKDNCGFMYIYDLLDELAIKWNEMSEQDKSDIAFCLIGDKNKLKVEINA